MSERFYEFGPYRLDASRCLLHRDGETVPLTPKAFDLLLALVEYHGEIISKDELMQRVWPDSFVEDGNLTYNVSVLRKALGERAGEHHYIVTVPGRGYRFVAAVNEASSAEVEAAAPELNGASATRTTDINQSNETTVNLSTRVARPRLAFAIVALAVAALVVVGGYLLFKRRAPSPVGESGQTSIRTLAVLPFENGSGDAEMNYLSDGISESLINSLSQLPGLKVIARSSSFKYKGKEIDPQEIARALGVEAIVTGRVLQRGDNLSISVELIDTRDKTQVWGEQYNRRATDLQVVQSEISREIAAKLRLKLSSAEQQQLAKRETVNPQAYERLLNGRSYANNGGTENRKRAVECYQQAIALDPAYARAYAELSVGYMNLVIPGLVDPKEFIPKAEAAALKALELDERLVEAHLALAWIKINTWDWAVAGREFNRAVELNPNHPLVHRRYSYYLSLIGRHEEAIAEAKRARELDPLSTNINWNVGYQLLLARQNDQAIEAARRLLELDQNSPEAYALLAYAYTAKGQYVEAFAAYQEAIKLGDNSSDLQIYLGAAYAKAGERAKAQAILRRLEGQEYVSPGALGALYIALGEREKAFAALERAYADHDNQMRTLGVDPNFDPLRTDPRFQDLLRRVGLTKED